MFDRKQAVGGSSVAVIGLGRFGGALAVELTRSECAVLGIDSDERRVSRYAEELPRAVVADGTDAEVLRQLGVPGYRRAVVAIGRVEASVLATALLVELGVVDVWATALGREQAGILQRVGACRVVLPEQEMGRRVAALMTTT